MWRRRVTQYNLCPNPPTDSWNEQKVSTLNIGCGKKCAFEPYSESERDTKTLKIFYKQICLPIILNVSLHCQISLFLRVQIRCTDFNYEKLACMLFNMIERKLACMLFKMIEIENLLILNVFAAL